MITIAKTNTIGKKTYSRGSSFALIKTQEPIINATYIKMNIICGQRVPLREMFGLIITGLFFPVLPGKFALP